MDYSNLNVVMKFTGEDEEEEKNTKRVQLLVADGCIIRQQL